jgi:lathosterol oxidase
MPMWPDYGWLYAVATILLVVIAHDTYFYWTHRLMHFSRPFTSIHRLHHLSVTPTPWTGFAFSPLEALIHAAYVPLFTAVFPLHWCVYTFFILHMMIRVVQIHSGIEIFSSDERVPKPPRWIVTTTHHDLHHRRGTSNYGLYFTFWDWLMGTQDAEYDREFSRCSRSHIPSGERNRDASAFASEKRPA